MLTSAAGSVLVVTRGLSVMRHSAGALLCWPPLLSPTSSESETLLLTPPPSVSSVWEVTSLFGLASLPQHQQYAHDPDRDSVELELDRESRSTFKSNSGSE